MRAPRRAIGVRPVLPSRWVRHVGGSLRICCKCDAPTGWFLAVAAPGDSRVLGYLAPGIGWRPIRPAAPQAQCELCELCAGCSGGLPGPSRHQLRYSYRPLRLWADAVFSFPPGRRAGGSAWYSLRHRRRAAGSYPQIAQPARAGVVLRPAGGPAPEQKLRLAGIRPPAGGVKRKHPQECGIIPRGCGELCYCGRFAASC